MITALVGLLVLGRGEPLVSLTVQAMPIERALAALSASCGVGLAASKQVSGEIVCFRFNGRPLSEAMSRLASCMDAGWKREGDVSVLTRTTAQVKEVERREFGADLAMYQKCLRETADGLKKLPAWSGDEADSLAKRLLRHQRLPQSDVGTEKWAAEGFALDAEAPKARLMAGLATALGAQELASLPFHYRTVWSTNPTSMQRAMSPEMLSAAQEFAQAETEWIAALDRNGVDRTALGDESQIDAIGGHSTRSAAISTILMTAEKESNGVAMLGAVAYDAKGFEVYRIDLNIGGLDEDEMSPKEEGIDDVGREPLIALPASSKRLIKALGNGAVPPDLLAPLTQAEALDPLSIVISPSLVRAAEIRNVNMVSSLGDCFFVAGLLGDGEDVRVNQFLQRLKINGAEGQIKDGWLTVKPRWASRERRWRADRKVLSEYLKKTSRAKSMSIEERAYFAWNLPPRDDNEMPETMAKCFSVVNAYGDDPNFIRFLGALTPDERHEIVAGGLRLAELNDRQTDCLNEMVFGSNCFLKRELLDPPRNGLTGQAAERFEAMSEGILSEMTQALPNGIPRDAVLTGVSHVTDAVMGGFKDDGFDGTGYAIQPADLAWCKFAQEHPDLLPQVNQTDARIDWAHLVVGKRGKVSFTFTFAPGFDYSEELDERDASLFRTVGLDGLPADYKKAFDAVYKAILAMKPEEIKMRGLTLDPPPPL